MRSRALRKPRVHAALLLFLCAAVATTVIGAVSANEDDGLFEITKMNKRVGDLEIRNNTRAKQSERKEMSLVWTANAIERLMPNATEKRTYEAAKRFLNRLSWELIDDYSNGIVLLEFNKFQRNSKELPRNVDPSLKLFHFGLFKNGVMKKLSECDEGAEFTCMGLERSIIWGRVQNWVKALLDRAKNGTERERENGGHEYWTHTWLEHDMEDNDEVSPVGASFLEHSTMEYGRDLEAVDALKDYLEATGLISGFSAEHEQNVRDVIQLATEKGKTGKYSNTWRATTWLVAVMHSRLANSGTDEKLGIQAIRLAFVFRPRIFDGDDNEVEDDDEGTTTNTANNNHNKSDESISEEDLPSIIEDMSDFLQAANWPGDLEEFEKIGLYALDRTNMGYALQVDVLPRKVVVIVDKSNDHDDDHGELTTKTTVLGPNVGVELAAASINGGFDALEQLEFAVDDGLIDKKWWDEMIEGLCKHNLDTKNKFNPERAQLQGTSFHACTIKPRKAADKLERLLPILDKNGNQITRKPITVALSHIKFGARGKDKLFAKAYVAAMPKPWWCSSSEKKPYVPSYEDDDYLDDLKDELRRKEHNLREWRTFRYKPCSV